MFHTKMQKMCQCSRLVADQIIVFTVIQRHVKTPYGAVPVPAARILLAPVDGLPVRYIRLRHLTFQFRRAYDSHMYSRSLTIAYTRDPEAIGEGIRSQDYYVHSGGHFTVGRPRMAGKPCPICSFTPTTPSNQTPALRYAPPPHIAVRHSPNHHGHAEGHVRTRPRSIPSMTPTYATCPIQPHAAQRGKRKHFRKGKEPGWIRHGSAST